MLAVMPFPQIDPVIASVTVFGMELALRWYALAYIAGIALGWWLVARMMRRPALWGGTPPMTPRQPEDLLTWMVLGVILGGRLGFVVFYQWDYYRENLGDILAIWQGGMSFHGGFLGVVAGVIGFSLVNRLPMIRVGDAVAVVAPIGIFFGRLANFINAELWGRVTDVPWAVVFPGTAAQTCEAVLTGTAEVCARHPSQLYEAVLEGLVLGLVMLWGVRRGWLCAPGRAIGVFLTGYGAARCLVEGFRQADAQFITLDNPMGHVWRLGDGVDALGLSMGQVLSLPMIGLGLLILLIARNRG